MGFKLSLDGLRIKLWLSQCFVWLSGSPSPQNHPWHSPSTALPHGSCGSISRAGLSPGSHPGNLSCNIFFQNWPSSKGIHCQQCITTPPVTLPSCQIQEEPVYYLCAVKQGHTVYPSPKTIQWHGSATILAKEGSYLQIAWISAILNQTACLEPKEPKCCTVQCRKVKWCRRNQNLLLPLGV